ncbi:cold-shock protein [Arcticibacter sp. MXS-1]|uniref:cold-shock protein n=1 Tax=Arcticibacter sp. MXS-1 TaxID=3341726 RepID=UPI0035A8E368
MGRSSETFSKKEKEKSRAKKQQDKKKKAAERKANSNKGKSLDDMIAYIDENGNITSTPPDQSARKEVKLEDIEIGVARQTEEEPADIVRNGVVSFFNTSKGFGFIRDLQTQESVFVHVNGLLEQVQEGDKVTFETEKGPKGLNAIKVKKK